MAVESNHAALGEGLRIFTDAMRRLIREKLRGRYGAQWWEKGVVPSLTEQQRANLRRDMEKGDRKDRESYLEPLHFTRIIPRGFDEAFHGVFTEGGFGDFQKTQAWLQVAANARNEWAHPRTGDMLPDEVAHALYDMAQLLAAAKLPEADGVEALRKAVLGIGAEPEAAPPPTSVMPVATGDLPYWWQVCEPHDAFKNPTYIDESLFAATLGGVFMGTARDEYLKPDTFFAHTYFTENLKQTIYDVASRLNGGPGPAVTEMQTPFGGGKTHALLALFHLFKHPQESFSVPGVREALGDLSIPPNTRVLVFDGMLYGTDPVEKENGANIWTLWGELAFQVDSLLFHRLISETDSRGESPGMLLYRQVLAAASPCLILIDELVSYLVKLKFANTRRTQNLYRQTLQFLQEMLQEASNVPGVVVLLSLPKSVREFGGLDPEQLQRELGIVDELRARANRVVTMRTPVNDDEVYTLMSKRLFKRVDTAAAEWVARTYREVYQRTAARYDPVVMSADYLKNQISAYPLHPELIDVLYKKWSTASDFPRTRAVLQLMASIVADQWVSRREAYTIQSSHVNLERERIRTRIVSAAGGGTWDAVVAADIIGGDAHADMLDQNRGAEYQRHHIARGVATSLLMHSFGGRGREGALRSELRLATVAPNLGPEYLTDILESLEQSLHYVHREGELLRFQTKVNIFRKIAEAAQQQPGTVVEEQLRAQMNGAAGSVPGFRVVCWEPSNGGLADQPNLVLALLEPKYAVTQENDEEKPSGYAEIRQLWDRSGGGLRQWRNALLLVTPDVGLWATAEAAMREVLAYGAVLEDIRQKRLEVSDNEQRDLQARERDKKDSLRTAIVAAYRWIFSPGDADLEAVALPGSATKDDTVAKRVVDRLSDPNYGTPKVMTTLGAPFFRDRIAPRVWQDEGMPLELGELRRRFLQWTYLPMLPNADDLLKNCTREGLRQRLWGVVIGDNTTMKYTSLVQRPDELDTVVSLFDGTASLARGALLGLILKEISADVEAEPEPTLSSEPVVAPSYEIGTRPGPIPAPAKRHTRVRLVVNRLGIGKTSNLQPYLFRVLQEQDAAAELTLTIEVRSDAGVPADVLEKRIVEGLEQLGIEVRWEAL